MANYKSGFERTIAVQLTQAKVKFEYEPVKFKYTTDHEYTPDFLLPNGIYIEVKGLLRREDRAKMIAVKKQHPLLDVRFVFMNAYGKIEGGKLRNFEWAERAGFKWAGGRIPEEWFSE